MFYDLYYLSCKKWLSITKNVDKEKLCYTYQKKKFESQFHTLDIHCLYLPCLLLVQIPAMDLDVSQEWKECESYGFEFTPLAFDVLSESINCKHESSGGLLRTFKTPTRKSSPFTLRYWLSMKWTPIQAESMPVYPLDNKIWKLIDKNINFSGF